MLDTAVVIGLEHLQPEARRNDASRHQAILQAEILIEKALREYCQEQKEAPLLRDFTALSATGALDDGVTGNDAEGALVPIALVAVTLQL